MINLSEFSVLIVLAGNQWDI